MVLIDLLDWGCAKFRGCIFSVDLGREGFVRSINTTHEDLVAPDRTRRRQLSKCAAVLQGLAAARGGPRGDFASKRFGGE